MVFFVEQQRLPAGEVLTRIVVDDEELSEAEERALAARPCRELGTVEFYTARPVDLAEEGLHDAKELLPGLAADLPKVAQELRSGKVVDGLELFGPCLEVLSWYVSLITAVDAIFSRNNPAFRSVEPDLNEAEELGAELDGAAPEAPSELRTFASIEILRQKLLDVEQAQERGDHLLLADLLEYELLPIIQIWAEESPQLLAKIQRESGEA
jgi:hypothetical protein